MIIKSIRMKKKSKLAVTKRQRKEKAHENRTKEGLRTREPQEKQPLLANPI